MSDLFPHLAESDSPRLAWMKRYTIILKLDHHETTWLAFSLSNPKLKTGRGETDEDAVVDFAKNNKLRLWNEGDL